MICIYIYIYVVKKIDNMPSRLLAIRHWPHGNTTVHNLDAIKEVLAYFFPAS